MNKPQQTSKVIPFTGELYTQPDPTPTPTAPSNASAFMVLVVAAMVGGLSLGAIATYQRADQVELRQLQAEREQLQQVKENVCNQR